MRDPVNASGLLDVGDGHRVYWEDWGDPGGIPVVLLHGGPGAGFNDSHKSLFDPARHHVLFHDQRGCGRSTPFASTEHNTTAELIGDIDALLEHRGWESAHLAGGSWGSTLALAYAIERTERVRGLTLWSIFLARRFDVEWAITGPPRYFFPREYERFLSLVPVEFRADPAAIMAYYQQRINDAEPAVARRHAVEWTLWEATLTTLDYDPARTEEDVAGESATTAIARIETHYLTNGCFFPADHLLDQAPVLRELPCTVVQGRFDMCTPPVNAHDLACAYGDRLRLQWVNAGHVRTDPELHAALRAALRALP